MKREEIIENGIFINNLEAVDIANHMERERNFEMNYKGVLPYSLELIKLNSLEDFSTKKYVNIDKNIYSRLVSDDVINVKFSCGQMDKEETIEYITKSTVKRVLHRKKYYKTKENEYFRIMKSKYPKQYKKYKDTINKIINDDVHKYNKTSAEDLRENLYVNGFTITKTIYPALIKEHEKYDKTISDELKQLKKSLAKVEKDIKKTKDKSKKEEFENKKELIEEDVKNLFATLETEIVTTNYKMWKRSSSKSRSGQVLYIKEELLEEMNNWGRMFLDFPVDEKGFDVVGLSAYSSLVGSHIEKTIKIKSSNILIVSDVLSLFDMEVNVVRKEDFKYKKITKRKATKEETFSKETIELMMLFQIAQNDKSKNKKTKYRSVFKKITTLEKERHLNCYKEVKEIESSLFDGQSLLDSQYFEDGQSMMLLRQAFFKSASFNCEVVQFLKDWYGDKYDVAEVKDMFGNRMRVNQVHMLITPNSLKALKFSKYIKKNENGEYIGTEKEMYKYWKKYVTEQDENIFGVCKHEKASKQGYEKLIKITKRNAEKDFKYISRKDIKGKITTIDRGNVIQQMSYQHLNCLRATKEEIKDLLKWEIDYINKAKSDINVYKDLLLRDANFMNSNEMIVDLLDTDYIHTEMFRKQRSQKISQYVNKIKGGKVKIVADNLVIVGNCYQMLLHGIGQLEQHGELNKKGELVLNKDYEDITLPNNDKYISCYTRLYKHNEVLCEFRNPCTSYSNIGLLQNVREDNNVFDKYFNFSKNIIAVNLINTEFQLVNSGSDQDSDAILCSNDSCLIKIADKSFRVDLPCMCDIPSQSNKYTLTLKDMARMDNKLSESKDIIGSVVNLGQLAMSEYYHTINSGVDKDNIEAVKRLEKLEEIVAVMTVLSGCAIDNAKRTYAISMDAEIKNVDESGLIEQKPMFWEYVSKSIKEKNANIRKKNKYKNANEEELELKTKEMLCPMEYIGMVLSDKDIIPKAKDDTENSMEFKDIIKDVSGKAKGEVIEYIKDLNIMLDDEIVAYKKAIAKENNKDEIKRQTIVLNNTYEGIIEELKKRKVNEKTMQMLLKNSIAQDDENVYYKTRMMKLLYTNNKNVFLNLFHKSN